MGGKSNVVVREADSMKRAAVYRRHAPEIARVAESQGDFAAIEECFALTGYRPQLDTLARIKRRERERKGEPDVKSVSVNKLFLYKDSASLFDAIVSAIKREFTRCENKVAALEAEMNLRLLAKQIELENKSKEIARLTSKPQDEDALMDLLGILKRDDGLKL